MFPCLSNYTENHRATSVGHDLITHYQNYLCEYELANPEDVVTSAADPTSLSFRTDPRPPAVSVSAEGGGRGRGRPRGSGRGRGRGRGRGGRGRSAGASAGASRAAGRAGKIRVPTYAPSDFAVGCTVRVFWKQGAFCLTLVPIRPRSRGERRSLRTFPGASLRPPLAFNL